MKKVVISNSGQIQDSRQWSILVSNLLRFRMFSPLLLSLSICPVMAVHEEGVPFDFEKALKNIRQMSANRDLKSLIAIADKAKEFLPASSYPRLRIISEICGSLNSVNFNDKAQFLILQTLATNTAREAHDGPLEHLVPIVQRIQIDFEFNRGLLRGAKWEHSRRENTRLLLHFVRRFSKEIDRKFNFEDLPVTNIEPPGGNYKAGISPDKIKEPEIRALYEKALKEAIEKGMRFNRQFTLRDQEKNYLRLLEVNVVRAYSIDPVNVEEVRSDFQEFGIPEELTNKVVKQLEARVLVLREREEKLRKLREKPPVFFPKISVGTLVEAKILSLDPQLQVPISFQKTKPKVQDMVTLLNSKTRMHITTSDNIPKDRLAYWSIYYHNVPAWSVMEQLNQAVTQKGHWVKQENGYQLVGELKPTLESLREALVKDREAPPGRSGFAVVLTIVSIIVLVCLAVLAFFYQRKQKTKI